MRIIILLSAIIIFNSCSFKKKANLQVNSNYNITNDSLLLNYYLANRISDCQNAKKFMKSVIKPDTIKTKLFYNQGEFHPIGSIYLSITGDKNSKKLENIVLFYIDLECLESLDYKELFSILCSEKDLNIIDKEFNSKRGKKGRYIFEVTINRMNCFAKKKKKTVVKDIVWDVHKILY